MHRTIIIAALSVLAFTQIATASTSVDKGNPEGSNGVTVDDLGRGLKSAAKNIENEIPKMGSAIGNAVKKIKERQPETPSPQEPAKQNKEARSYVATLSSRSRHVFPQPARAALHRSG